MLSVLGLVVLLAALNGVEAQSEFTRMPILTHRGKDYMAPPSLVSGFFASVFDVDHQDVNVTEFWEKVVLYDLWQANGGTPERLVIETSPTVFITLTNLREGIEQDVYTIADIERTKRYHCPDWCYKVTIDDMVTYNDLIPGANIPATRSNLLEALARTMIELNDISIQTIGNKFCANMTKIEVNSGMKILAMNNSDWRVIVPEIILDSLQCLAGKLSVTVEELTELTRTNYSDVIAYTLQQYEDIFLARYNDLVSRKNRFDNELFAGFLTSGWMSETFAYHADNIAGFTVRDLEILYRWETAQLFAIENISLSTYAAFCGSLNISQSSLKFAEELFGYQTNLTSCLAAFILT